MDQELDVLKGYLDLVPRNYQREMFKIGCERNTILFLPTGAGKTFISILLMRHYAPATLKPYDDREAKRIIFIAPTVKLLEQQESVIKRFTPFEVQKYCGSMGVDLWRKEEWVEELNKYQVLVMSAQILLNNLDKGFMTMSKINLLIFDECHHATEKHPMNEIMKNHYTNSGTRIIGLTATIAKRNIRQCDVPKAVAQLEKNLDSQIIRLNFLDEIKGLYANPTINSVPVKSKPPHALATIAIEQCEHLKSDIEKLAKTDPDIKKEITIQLFIEGELMQSNNSIYKQIKRMVDDIIWHIKKLGIYGGYVATLAHYTAVERMIFAAQSMDIHLRLAFIQQKLLSINKNQLVKAMENHELVYEKIMLFSTPKILKLLAILRHHLSKVEVPDEEDNIKDFNFRSIVFVERRITALTIYHILKGMSESDPAMKYLRPIFVVGQNKKSFLTREQIMIEKRNRDAMELFNVGEYNLVVASNVLEEGMDVPKCNLVIKMDAPVSYCSFVQSKGRARDANADYYVLDEEESDTSTFRDKHPSFASIEKELQRLQNLDNDALKAIPVVQEETYVVQSTGATARPSNSVPIIHRYCQSLGTKNFADISPLWYMKSSEEYRQCTLLLPLNPYYCDKIEGEKKHNSKDARDSAAFTAVKLLHQCEALNEYLLPNEKKQVEIIESQVLFPNWQVDDERLPYKPGTKKAKTTHMKHTPEVLQNCAPTANKPLFLYILNIEPVFAPPADENIRDLGFYKLLLDETEGLAILTATELPQLCEFPVFLTLGQVNVNITKAPQMCHLTRDQLACARHLHFEIFKLLNLNQKFLTCNFESGNNNYLIVPTIVGPDGLPKLNIDLIVKSFSGLDVQDTRLTGNEPDLDLKVVTPWYRSFGGDKASGMIANKNYIVIHVDHSLNPNSFLPDTNDTYQTYYLKKYALKIENEKQPLLIVKPIPSRLNLLLPRGAALTGNRKQWSHTEYNEVFVPELCDLMGVVKYISSQLWLKATFLPSVLFFITRLLVANDVRKWINAGTGLGVVQLPDHEKWKPITMPETSPETEKDDDLKGFGPPELTVEAPDISKHLIPWNEELECLPVDIDLNLLTICKAGIKEYEQFASARFISKSDSKNRMVHPRDMSIVVRPIQMLSNESERGPELSSIYAAITTTAASEIVNLERLETLGDSFLKFAASFYLFCSYAEDEGTLTVVKGKLVGNRNLFYCGKKKNLQGVLNPHSFYSHSQWKPPNLEIDQKLREYMENHNLPSNGLQKVVIPEVEQKNGVISQESLLKAVNGFQQIEYTLPDETALDDAGDNSYDVFLDKQTVQDKVVSDCVEALLGSYVEACGPVAAVKVLSWFQILPNDAVQVLQNGEAPVGYRQNNKYLIPTEEHREAINFHLAGTHSLEQQLNYKFKNRSILLQAISHASYISNRLTDSFQRLEFLGDAVLDFLITSYIYENFGSLTPGQLTDLRSALVNNITLGSLTVKYGLQKHLRYECSKIMSSIEKFVIYQEATKHHITGEHMLLFQENCSHAHCIEVPKILGDIFESFVGAVFLDSGRNLIKTWEVFYPLMKAEIDNFASSVPKSPLRILHETVVKKNIQFDKCVKEKEHYLKIKLTMKYLDKDMVFYGYGENRSTAKAAAAKCALRHISKIKPKRS